MIMYMKPFLILCLSMAFIMGGFFSYLAASPFVFQSIYGYSAFGYSIIFAINAFIISLCAQLSGRLSRRLGDPLIVKISCSVMLLSAMAMIFIALIKSQSSIPAFVALTCFVALLGASQTSGFGIVMSARTGGAGSASGIFGVLGFLLGALMSPLVGLLGETSMLPLALCMFISALFSYILFVLGLKLKQSSKTK